MLNRKLFSDIISLHSLVVKWIVRELTEDTTLLKLGADIIAFFIIGFQMHPNYFIMECFKSLEEFASYLILTTKEEESLSIRDTKAWDDAVLDFIILLKAAMVVHPGYPELYLPLVIKLDSFTGGHIEGEQQKIQDLINHYTWKFGSYPIEFNVERHPIEDGVILRERELNKIHYRNIQKEETKGTTDAETKTVTEHRIKPKNNLETSSVKTASEFKFKGLVNMGNTCYISSFLQAIFMNTDFRACIIQEFSAKMPSIVSDSESKLAFKQLCMLFWRMCFSRRPSIRPYLLKLTLPEFFQNSEQHDCSEFAKIILDQLEKEVKALKKRNIVSDYFKGKVIQRVECETCHSISSTIQDYIDISLSLELKEDLK